MGNWEGYPDSPVYYYNGVEWSKVDGPYQRPQDFFYDVEFLNADYGWAVGSDTYYWDGERWTLFKIPEAETGPDYVVSLCCVSENDVWIGGADGRIMHFTGFE